MYEKLVEHWLTEVNELGYQLPFCEALLFEGFTVAHVSTHGRGEHGKDIVARRKDGVVCTFQLKGGDILLSQWRAIRGEVEELVTLPPRTPGYQPGEPYIPILVTNGEVRGDAVEGIQQSTEEWVRRGYPRLEVWTRGIVQQKFVTAKEHFLPNSMADFRRFVELFTADFTDRLPREEFATFLDLFTEKVKNERTLETKRALASMSIVSGYIAEGYERANNHLAAAEVYAMTAAATLGVAEKFVLDDAVFVGVLDLLRLGFDRAMGRLTAEVLESNDFVVRKGGAVDGPFYGARALLCFGWVSAWLLRNDGPSDSRRRLLKTMLREAGAIRVATEAEWPLVHSVILFLERNVSASDGEVLLGVWLWAMVNLNKRKTGPGIPNPYWSTEKAIQLRLDMLPPYERERFQGRSFTLAQCLDCLVRRLCRQKVWNAWGAASRLEWCEFIPSSTHDYFRWRTKAGELRVNHPALTVRWSEWRDKVARVSPAAVPAVLLRHPDWLLPFLLCYPHRANVSMTALVEALIARRAEVS